MPKEPSGLPADRSYSYQKLERIATRVRERLDLSPTSAIDALLLFDGRDITVKSRSGRDIPIRGTVVELEDMEGYAKYDIDRQIIEIQASTTTYDWLEQDYPRGRFFLAHELGHCLLHTDQLVRMAQMPTKKIAALHYAKQTGATHEFCLDTEWQANAFAGAFLMPARGISVLEQEFDDALSPVEIAEHFRVSTEAATYRLESYKGRKDQLL